MEAHDHITFTPKLVDSVGEIGQVLGAFLNNQTARIQTELESKYPEIQSTAVKKLLNEFVTLDGTKKPILKEKTNFSFLDQMQTDHCLDKLEQARILRLEDGIYELAHDTLALKIAEERSTEDVSFLETIKLVKDRYSAYNTTGALLNSSELAIINNNRKRLLEEGSFQEEEWRFVNKSIKEIRKKRILLSSITIAVIVILLLFSLFSYQQRLIAQSKQKEALIAKQEAEASLLQLKKEQEQKTEAQYEQYLANGKALMAQNNYLGAIQEFNTALVFKPKGEEAQQLKSKAEIKTGAKQQFEKMLSEGDALSRQGNQQLVYARSKYQAALQTGYNNNLAMSKINSLKPLLEEAYSEFKKKGDTFFNASGYDLALQYYKSAQKIKPGNSYIEKQISLCKQKM